MTTNTKAVSEWMESLGFHRGSNSFADCWWDKTGNHQITNWAANVFYSAMVAARKDELATLPRTGLIAMNGTRQDVVKVGVVTSRLEQLEKGNIKHQENFGFVDGPA